MKRLTLCFLALVIAGGAFAAAPQFRVDAAHYSFNAHSQNWDCDPTLLAQLQAEGLGCKSRFIPSYTFMHQIWVTQNRATGAYVGIADGGARDGGFEPRVGDVSSTWRLAGAQAGTHTLMRTRINDDSVLGCTQLVSGEGCNWELDSTLWGDPATALNALYTFYGVYDTGYFPNSQRHWFVLGESFNGISNFTWTPIFKVVRPTGDGSGAGHLLNRFSFIQHPTIPTRWIGLMSWTFDKNGVKFDGSTPVYIDKTRGKFGVQLQDAGWCEYNFGQQWSEFSDTNSCGSGTTLGDNFYRALPDKTVSDLSLIDGKALILRMRESVQRCENWSARGYASKEACAIDHAPCPATQDKNLYVSRRQDPFFAVGRYWTVQEIDLATWNTAQRGHQLNGGEVTIADGAQAAQFKINPTDQGGVGSYHGGSLRQFNDGKVYLYLPVKHSLCMPETDEALNTWNRPPKNNSGNSTMWLRLVQ